MVQSYKPPRALREWARDIPGGELYQLYVFDDRTVCAVVGRYSHSSGSTTCTWEEFLAGSLAGVVQATMGADILGEACAYVSSLVRA